MSAISTGWAERMVAMWARCKAKKLRNSFNSCRTAYMTGPLAGPTSRYAAALEKAALIFDELEKELKAEGIAKLKAASPFNQPSP